MLPRDRLGRPAILFEGFTNFGLCVLRSGLEMGEAFSFSLLLCFEFLYCLWSKKPVPYTVFLIFEDW